MNATIVLSTLLIVLGLAAPSRSGAVTLPNGCGNSQTTFAVHTHETSVLPSNPSQGRALVVVIQKQNTESAYWLLAQTTRIGLDGKWSGADHGNSWFAFEVAPGAHQLCANLQGKEDAATLAFTAAPGKTYFFQAHLTDTVRTSNVGGGIGPGGPAEDKSFHLVQLTAPEGLHQTQSSKRSISHPKS